jgi:1,4-dihydroxy-2-naphthoate octaprenyltransferase
MKQNQEISKAKSTTIAGEKAASSQIIAAESVQAEEVPTIPLDSLQTLNTLQPEIAVRSVTATQTAVVPEPLVVQPAEYRLSLREWLVICRDGVRLPYLVYPILPLALGSVLAWLSTISSSAPRGDFHFERFLAALVALVLMQIGANVINDYYDYLGGVDTSNSLGPGGLIQQGLIKPARVLSLGLLFLIVGALIGILAALSGGIAAFTFGVLGLLSAYFYSVSSRSLSALTLGEVTVFWVFGPFITLGAYVIQRDKFDLLPLVCSISLGLLFTAALYVNNMRDVESDTQSHKHTLATLLGVRLNRIVCTALLLGAYVPVLFLGLPSHGPHLILITLWTLPSMVAALVGIYRTVTPASLHLTMRQLLKLAALFTFLMIVALIVSTYWRLWPSFSVPGLPFVF